MSKGLPMEIAVRQLTRTFGALRANDALSLSFAAGQIHGVLGENGAGKSTLMKMLSGFLLPTSGAILLEGRELRLRGPADALRAGIGMVHQDPLDVPAFTVIENLRCAAPRGKLGSLRSARRELPLLAQRLGFELDLDAPIARLTVGQRQQVEILRLIALGAQVFILDEPTTGITAAQARALFGALKQLASEGKTVLFVSHKLEEVAEICDTVAVLRAGKLVAPGQQAMPIAQADLLAMMFGPASATPHPPQLGRADLSRPPVLALQRATLREGALALRGLDLQFAPGQTVGLAGLEGSGQQLLLQALAGRLPLAAGRLLLDGVTLTRPHGEVLRQTGVQYLPADRLAEGMIGEFSLSEHFALQAHDGAFVDRRVARQTAVAAIAEYQIKATPETPIARLSGGNQQRAMLALLPADCRALLCDQPTRGLDIASAQAIWARLRARRDAGAAIVFASADLDEVLEQSDLVLVFFGGMVSAPLPRAELSYQRLAELIGGVGFVPAGAPQ